MLHIFISFPRYAKYFIKSFGKCHGRTYHLRNFLVDLLKSISINTPKHMKNPVQFEGMIKKANILSIQMMSLDVVNLFNKIWSKRICLIVRNRRINFLNGGIWISVNDKLIMLMFGVFFYIQTLHFWLEPDRKHRSHVSPLYLLTSTLNFGMNGSSLKHSIWFRYEDDTFILKPLFGRCTISELN